MSERNEAIIELLKWIGITILKIVCLPIMIVLVILDLVYGD